MSSKATILLLVAFLVATFSCAANALTGCHVNVYAAPRPYSWQDGGKTYNIYDVTVTNVGTCPVYAVRMKMQPDDSSVVFSQTWNLFQQDPTHFALQNFGNTLYPNQIFGAGFVIGYSPSSSQGIVDTTLVSGLCPATGDCANDYVDGKIETCADLDCGLPVPQAVCIEDGGIPRCIYTGISSTTTGSASTTGTTGTTGTSTTGSATSTTGSGTTTTGSGTTTGGSGVCAVGATMTARSSANSGNWTDDAGRPNQIYDISITNQGTCIVTGVRLSFTLPSNSVSYISQRWNLDDQYNVNTYGNIPVNGGFGGAGVVLTGPGPFGVNVASKTCDCSNVH